MSEESRLYELVWGEPDPAARAHSRPPAVKPAPPVTKPQTAQQPERTAQGQGEQDVHARLEAIETTMAELLQAVQQLGSSTMSQEMVLISLEALESRMGRMEKGLVRSLEYLETRITGARRR